MSKLFVSWTFSPDWPSGTQIEFGNAVLDLLEPESYVDIQKIELRLQNKLTEERGKICIPRLLFFKVLNE